MYEDGGSGAGVLKVKPSPLNCSLSSVSPGAGIPNPCSHLSHHTCPSRMSLNTTSSLWPIQQAGQFSFLRGHRPLGCVLQPQALSLASEWTVAVYSRSFPSAGGPPTSPLKLNFLDHPLGFPALRLWTSDAFVSRRCNLRRRVGFWVLVTHHILNQRCRCNWGCKVERLESLLLGLCTVGRKFLPTAHENKQPQRALASRMVRRGALPAPWMLSIPSWGLRFIWRVPGKGTGWRMRSEGYYWNNCWGRADLSEKGSRIEKEHLLPALAFMFLSKAYCRRKCNLVSLPPSPAERDYTS